jgi:hypothetical protein
MAQPCQPVDVAVGPKPARTVEDRSGRTVRHNSGMDPVLLSQLLPLIGAVAGAMVGGLTAYAAGVHKSRADLRIAEMNLQTQLEIAEGQRQVQISIDRDRQNRQKVEEAYGNLMEWLFEIESTIEDISSGLFSDDEECLVKCMQSIDEWEWTTLKAPKYTAATRYFWSDSVHGLLGKLYRSSKFTEAALHAYCIRHSPEVMRKCVGAATAERRQKIKNEDEGNKKALADVRREMRVGRSELLGVIGEVRNQVRLEMLSDRVD